MGLILLFIVFTFIFFIPNQQTKAICEKGKYKLTAGTNQERINFLSQFGWQVNNKPISQQDIVVPKKFEKEYEDYNKIQKKQGLDLKKFEGKTCKKIVYFITNYPEKAEEIKATLLIRSNKVIGGDISSSKYKGLMHGFLKP
jgi:hypothetical protein